MTVPLIILRKELLDTIRDRRTLLVMVLLPIVIIPLVFAGLDAFMKSQMKKAGAVHYRVAINHLPAKVRAALRTDTRIRLYRTADPIGEVKSEKALLGLVVSKNFEQRLKAGKSSSIKVVVDEANQRSTTSQANLLGLLEALNRELAAERLISAGVDPNAMRAIDINTHNVATSEEVGAMMLSFFLPLIIVMWSIMGGMYTAIDVSAGEKERQTLENLLLVPAKRRQIVLGKCLAVFTVSTVALMLGTASMYFTFQRFPISPAEGAGTSAETAAKIVLAPEAAVLLLLTALLVAAMASALMVTIGIFAKSFKEGQNYMTPLLFAVIIPAIAMSAMPDNRFAPEYFLIPVFNAMLVFKELVLGQINWLHLAMTGLSLTVFTVASLALATFIFNQERVMFRD